MAQIPLVDRRIEDGRKLIEALVAAGFDVRVAFWLYLDEAEEWRLMIGTEEIARRGIFDTYGRLGDIRDALPNLSIRSGMVTVLPLDTPMVKDALKFLKKYPEPTSYREYTGMLGKQFFVDVYIYPKLPAPEVAKQS